MTRCADGLRRARGEKTVVERQGARWQIRFGADAATARPAQLKTWYVKAEVRPVSAAVSLLFASLANAAHPVTISHMSPIFEGGDNQTPPRAARMEQLYPYLVPKEYLSHVDPAAPTESLGHGVYVTLVLDFDGLVRGVTRHDLSVLGLDWSGARARAMLNLATLANRQAISTQLFPKGPGGLPFILVGGHWAAAALILSPKLPGLASEKLGTHDVCASVPHREALLLFPCGTRESRNAMRALIRKNESNAPKPLTFGFFALRGGGAEPIADD